MKENISIRRWVEEDWEVFKAIRLEALGAHSDVFGASFKLDSEKDPSFWRQSLGQGGAVFGLYDGETVIGLTGVYRHRDSPDDTAILCMSYIRKEYRGFGLSDILYKARIDWAREQTGIRQIIVGCRDGNEASRRANQRWGFTLLSTEDMTFGNGETAKHYTYELKI